MLRWANKWVFFYFFFSNCWSGYQCTFSRDPLQWSNMYLNDKTVIKTEHIVYCNDQTSWKKGSKTFKILKLQSEYCMHSLQIGDFTASSFSLNSEYSDYDAQEYLILPRFLITRGPKGPEPLTWVNRPKVKLIIWINLTVWNCLTMTDIGLRLKNDLDLHCT